MEQVAINITGAGASFPQPIYAKWSADFKEATSGQVNYQSIGSSGWYQANHRLKLLTSVLQMRH